MDNTEPQNIILEVSDLQAYYGQSHVLQGVDFTLGEGAFSIIGRNGMGKTTLCNRLMGLLDNRGGSVKFMGQDITNHPANQIAKMGIGYVPQGRRLWPSLTVDEHLRLFANSKGSWTKERIYEHFPRLDERRGNQGGQLSGGEQQMLAISRALLQNPKLLILDEPTEGLSPVIVEHVESLLETLVAEKELSILLIEQNISTALRLSDKVGVMVNGRLEHVLDSHTLKHDHELQKKLLGIGHVEDEEFEMVSGDGVSMPSYPSDGDMDNNTPTNVPAFTPPTRWGMSDYHLMTQDKYYQQTKSQKPEHKPTVANDVAPLYQEKINNYNQNGYIYVVGTFDTKADELNYMKDCLHAQGKKVKTVDLSTTKSFHTVDVPAHIVASYHPNGNRGVFTNDRGESVTAMSIAFETYLTGRTDIAGVITAGGSGGTALASPAMRALSVGIPKLIVSTVASGDVAPYVGASDITMMYSVTDVQGLNRISRQILKNASYAISGMSDDLSVNSKQKSATPDKPAVGFSMFGVTTPAVQQIMKPLENDYDCLVFHATGIGGQSMEKLVDSGMIKAVVDLTTTEIADLMAGGVMPALDSRLDVFTRNPIPYIGSLGAIDMVNFGGIETVPAHYKNRNLVVHNAQVTLMRTNEAEVEKIAHFLCEKLNAMQGPVDFLIPEGGVSALDAPEQQFYAPKINQIAIDILERDFHQTANRRLIKVPHHINDEAFAQTVLQSFHRMVKI